MCGPGWGCLRLEYEQVELVGPELGQFSPQGRQALRTQSVEVEPSLLPAGHQADVGEQDQMLGYGRSAHRESRCQLADGLFAVAALGVGAGKKGGRGIVAIPGGGAGGAVAGLAGEFLGDVKVSGNLSKGGARS